MELAAAAAYLYDTNYQGSRNLISAIGSGDFYFMAQRLAGETTNEVFKSGVADAVPAVEAKARAMCERAGSPILTRGQHGSLMAIVAPGLAAVLDDITRFA